MNKKILIIIVIVLVVFAGIFLFGGEKEKTKEIDYASLEEAKEIAQNWIINESPTYVFDGFDLMIEDAEEIIRQELYRFVFSFNSRSAGYGDRTQEISAQVITPHTMEVIMEKAEVITAITDRIYDEIEGRMIEEAEDTEEETLLETMRIKLYFVKTVDGQEEIVEVERTVPFNIAAGRAAIEELLKGLLSSEEAEGLSTAINKGVELLSLEIQDGVARADFNEKLEEGVAGSAWVNAIRSQIEQTLLQFDTVNEVVISINSRTEDILQP